MTTKSNTMKNLLLLLTLPVSMALTTTGQSSLRYGVGTTNHNHNHIAKKQQHRNTQMNVNSTERIVGGSDVTSPAAYPFFADWWRGCGGSLVAPDMVLTAAHASTFLFLVVVVLTRVTFFSSNLTDVVPSQPHSVNQNPYRPIRFRLDRLSNMTRTPNI